MTRHPLQSVAAIWLGLVSERLHLRMAMCSSKPRSWPGKWSTSRLQTGIETPCLQSPVEAPKILQQMRPRSSLISDLKSIPPALAVRMLPSGAPLVHHSSCCTGDQPIPIPIEETGSGGSFHISD